MAGQSVASASWLELAGAITYKVCCLLVAGQGAGAAWTGRWCCLLVGGVWKVRPGKALRAQQPPSQ